MMKIGKKPTGHGKAVRSHRSMLKSRSRGKLMSDEEVAAVERGDADALADV